MKLNDRLDVAHQQKIPAVRDAKRHLEEALETLQDVASIDSRFGSPVGRILEAVFQIDGVLIEESSRNS